MNRTDDETSSASGSQHGVQANLSAEPGYVPGSRKAEELAAIEEVLRRTPRKYQGKMRDILEDPTSNFVSSSDPEIARLLGVIASIRAADNAPAMERAYAVMQADLEDQKRRVIVTLALVSSLPALDARAVVLRRPGDNGRPLLLLSASSATSADLRLGLRAAAEAYVRYGPSPTSERRFLVKPTGPAQEESGSHANMLKKLRASPQRIISGLGSVRAMEVFTRTTLTRG